MRDATVGGARASWELLERRLLLDGCGCSQEDETPAASLGRPQMVGDVVPYVYVVARDPVAAEHGGGVNRGLFLIGRTGPYNVGLSVSFELFGSASEGGDYEFIGGSVDFAPGQRFASVSVAPIDDGSFDPDETVTLELVTEFDYALHPNAALQSATVRILDDEPMVFMRAIDPIAAETTAGLRPNGGAFLIARTGVVRPNTPALTVSYTVGGSATGGEDFAALGGQITIPAGQRGVVLRVDVLDDSIAEDEESVAVSLASSDGYGLHPLAALQSSQVRVLDNEPYVLIVAADRVAAEVPEGLRQNPGDFFVIRTGPVTKQTPALTVHYTVAGTASNGEDYEELTGSVTIPTGFSFASLPVNVIDDLMVEPNETVQVSLDADGAYRLHPLARFQSDTVTIFENDALLLARGNRPVVSIAATDPAAAETATGEPLNPGRFRVTRDNNIGNLAVVLRRMGDAVLARPGGRGDFTLTGTNATGNVVVIPDGSFSADIDVNVIDDLDAEETESVIFEIVPTQAYDVASEPAQRTAKVEIEDNEPKVSITAAVEFHAEEIAVSGELGRFRIDRDKVGPEMAVTLGVGLGALLNTDYKLTYVRKTQFGDVTTEVTNGVVHIPVNEDHVYVYVEPINDDIAEPTEEITLTVLAPPRSAYSVGAADSATVFLIDNEPIVTVDATLENANESDPNGQPYAGFIIYLNENTDRVPSEALPIPTDLDDREFTVAFKLEGTAVYGTDYTLEPDVGTTSGGSVTIPQGYDRVFLRIVPLGDSEAEDFEDITLTASSGPGYRLKDDDQFLDDPSSSNGIQDGPITETYDGSFFGSGTEMRTNSFGTCTWSTTYDGTISLTTVRDGTGPTTATASLSGSWISPPGTSTNPSEQECLPSNSSLSLFTTATISGTSVSFEGYAASSMYVRFSGSISNGRLTGSMQMEYVGVGRSGGGTSSVS